MFKIIVCDDEPTLRNGLKKLIERSGLSVSVSALASNGTEALELIQSIRPSIVLMDINMPGISGLEVIEQVRLLSIPVKFIIISGHDEFQYAQKACRLEVSDYLLKPINKEELLSLLKKMIEKLQQKESPNPPLNLPEPEALPDTQSRRILHYVKQNFSDNSLTLTKLSDEFHLSQSYVTRIIKQESGKSFTDLLNQYRIDYAALLLTSQKDLKLWAVADACGFASQHYFSRVFKQTMGCTPAEYRKVNRSEN